MAGQYPGHYGNSRQYPPQMFTPSHPLARSSINSSSPDLYHPMSGAAGGSSNMPYQNYLPANMGRAGHPNITGYQNQLPLVQTTTVNNAYSPAPHFKPDSEDALARRYALKPPLRHAPLHKTRDLGFPDFFPQTHKQVEDQLLPTHITDGFYDRQLLTQETESFHGSVNKRLHERSAIEYMQSTMLEILKRKRETTLVLKESGFKIPNRISLPDERKEQWLKDLADATVPLHQLALSVPHGYRGEKLFDVLCQRRIPLIRAVWFFKIVGANDMTAAQKGKSAAKEGNTNKDQTIVWWTTVFESFLNRQVMELAGPQNESSTGSRHAHTSTKPWNDEQSMERWTSRWCYSTNLARWLTNEGLLDQRHFLKWTLDVLSHATCEQTSVLIPLISAFVGEYGRSRALMRILIDGLLDKATMLMRHHPNNETGWQYTFLENELCQQLRYIFANFPDMFVHPPSWQIHKDTIARIIIQKKNENSSGSFLYTQCYHWVDRRNNDLISTRNLSIASSPISKTPLGESERSPIPFPERIKDPLVECAKRLDRLGPATDFHRVASLLLDPPTSFTVGSLPENDSRSQYFHRNSQSNDSFSEPFDRESRIRWLCEWAVTAHRSGDHRVYAVASVLEKWCSRKMQDSVNANDEHASDHAASSLEMSERRSQIQEILMGFLDTYVCTTGRENEEYDSISRLFGDLIRKLLFSYQKYLQRLIARGDMEPGRRHEERTLRHFKYLRSFPLYKPQPHSLNQRRVLLYGVDGTDAQDTEFVDAVISHVAAKLTYLFTNIAQSCDIPTCGSSTVPGTTPYYNFLTPAWIAGTPSGMTAATPTSHSRNSTDGTPTTCNDITAPMVDDPVQDFALGLPLEQDTIDLLQSSSRFVQVRVTHEWLLGIVKNFVVKNVRIGLNNWRVITSPGFSLLNPRQYSTICRVMEVAKDYCSLLEVTLWLLDHTNERTLFPVVVDTLRRHQLIWAAMGETGTILQAVDARHLQLKQKGAVHRSLIMYAIELAQSVESPLLHELNEDVHLLKQASTPPPIPSPSSLFANGRTNSSLVHDLTKLISAEASMSDVITFSSTLWYRNQGATDLPLRTLNACVQALREGAAEGPAFLELRRRASVCADLLRELGDRLGTRGIDETVSKWIEHSVELTPECRAQPAAPELEESAAEAIWFLTFLVLLVVKRCCRLETIIDGVCKNGLITVVKAIEMDETKRTDNTVATVCNNLILLLRLLLIQETGESMAERLQLCTQELHALVTQRFSAFQDLASLSLPFVLLRTVIRLECALPSNHPVRSEVQLFKRQFVFAGWFREACLANAEGVYEKHMCDNTGGHAETDEAEMPNKPEFRRKLLSTFRMLIGEGSEPALLNHIPEMYVGYLRDIISRLNIWVLDRSRVELRLLLDQVIPPPSMKPPEIKPETLAVNNLGDSGIPNTAGFPSSDAAAIGSTTNAGPQACLDAMAEYLFEEMVIPASYDPVLLAQLFQGLRADLANGFLSYGVKLLGGPPEVQNNAFPKSIIIGLNSGSVRCTDLHRTANAFYFVMSALLTDAVNDHLAPDESKHAKTDFVKALLTQVQMYKEPISVFRVMQAVGASYEEASNALTAADGNVDRAMVSLPAHKDVLQGRSASLKITPTVLRDNLAVRLRLLVPLLSIIKRDPGNCCVIEWCAALVSLLTNPLIHGNGTEGTLFEFVLDLVSYLMDEIPKDYKNKVLVQLRAIRSDLHLPAKFSHQIQRVLPFQVHNAYISTLDAENIGYPLRPWEWIEQLSTEKIDTTAASFSGSETPIPLVYFKARRIKATEMTYERQYRKGLYNPSGDPMKEMGNGIDDAAEYEEGELVEPMPMDDPPAKRRHV